MYKAQMIRVFQLPLTASPSSPSRGGQKGAQALLSGINASLLREVAGAA